MEMLYNPNAMSEKEIRETFVGRQKLVNELVSLIEHQPDGPGVQHVVIIAPRGMGKTTILLMVQFTVKDRGLDARWQTVMFPEEAYGVYDLADLWLETLKYLATDTHDKQLQERVAKLKEQFPDSDDLQEAALALIKDWRRQHGKRLMLLIDNFDMLLEQIQDERDNARLRDVLMNDGTLMIIGGATTFFREAWAYDQPLYNFFEIYELGDLRSSEIEALLWQRAKLDNVEDFEATLKANAGRFRALEYFTGGNPRLVLMLYRVITQSDISEVRRGLEKLLDEVTPYYKAKTETLPAQQRKILDHIARRSSENHEGVTPTEVAEATRMTPNQASVQLKRLSELGYVRATNLRGRSSFYALSEPLYAIWYQMRFGRDARQRMRWLVDFLRVWYDAEEMRVEAGRLDARFREYLSANRLHEARDILEHRRYIAEVNFDVSGLSQDMDDIIRGYLELNDIDTLKKELLPFIQLDKIPLETLIVLCEAGCIGVRIIILPFQVDVNIAVQILVSEVSPAKDRKQAELIATLMRAVKDLVEGQTEAAQQQLDYALKIDPKAYQAWSLYVAALNKMGRYEEAIDSCDQALDLFPDDQLIWFLRACALHWMGRHEEAVNSYDFVLQLNPDPWRVWYSRGVALDDMGQDEEAVTSYDRALQLNPDCLNAWNNRGSALNRLGRYEEATASFDRALQLDPDYPGTWYNRALAYLFKFAKGVIESPADVPKADWTEALQSAKRIIDKEVWHQAVTRVLLIVAQSGHLELVQQLLNDSNLKELIFPLARAIDYLLTGDEALIEKLSPEVRGIVEEIVAKLSRPIDQKGQPKTKSRTGKAKSTAPRRTTKALR